MDYFDWQCEWTMHAFYANYCNKNSIIFINWSQPDSQVRTLNKHMKSILCDLTTVQIESHKYNMNVCMCLYVVVVVLRELLTEVARWKLSVNIFSLSHRKKKFNILKKLSTRYSYIVCDYFCMYCSVDILNVKYLHRW